MTWRIDQGDVLDVLGSYSDESVNCIVTSPPYWRQRDYGMAAQMGLEETPEEYVDAMTRVFAECRRVLTKDGTCWVNIGDKWASGGNGGGGSYMEARGEAWAHARNTKGWRSPPSGYKDKDLVGVPWMLAFSMRAEGWYLRQCNIWAKPNGMPESVQDRSTISHEYVFQFSKNNDYWYDIDAARTPPAPSTETRLMQNIDVQEGSHRANGGAKTNGTMKPVLGNKQRGHSRKHDGFNARWDAMTKEEQMANGANLRSVWWISPAQYRKAHYAVMPEALAEICILAGCPEEGTVLDPFAGAGTTLMVALRHNRNAIGIELNPEYVAMAKTRITDDAPLFNGLAL